MWTPSPEEWNRLEPLVDELLELAPDARQALIERSFSTTPELRDWVERLVAGASDASWLRQVSPSLVSGAFDDDAAGTGAPIIGPGALVGPFRLVRELGRGGMGQVFLAEREGATFAQRVALKVVAGARVSEGMRRRFVAEQRALARLEHPNVARLVDGGIRDDGLPWLAMEYVEGERIDHWCDERRLPVRARLRLVLQVCRAVEAAHQRLVIHRDLKPSNILATPDGSIRLLDFGVAKLLASDDEADATRGDALPFTPEYAAPEQWRHEPATTATDCYALGVILYQLLTARRPVDFHGAPRYLWGRLVHDTVPRPPSAVVDEAAARTRDTSLPALRRALRGDLDAITCKALEVDAARRYPTVRDLADDLQRHLGALPVSAREPGTWYRTTRFVRRHRASVIAASAVTLALAAGVVATGWQARRARQAANEALAVSRFLRGLFVEASPLQARGDAVTAAEMLQRATAGIDSQFAGQPDMRVQMLLTVGEIERDLGAYARADSAVRRAAAIADSAGRRDLTWVAATSMRGELARVRGDFDAADSLFRDALAVAATIGAPDTTRAQMIAAHGHVLYRQGRFDDAIRAHREAAALGLALGPLFRANALGSLALALDGADRNAEAGPAYAQALAIFRAAGLDGHPDQLQTLGNRASLFAEQWELDSARALQSALLQALRRIDPNGHDRVVIALNNLAFTYLRLGEPARAESGFAEAHAMAARLHGPAHPLAVIPLNNVGRARVLAGRAAAAESVLRRSQQLIRQGPGPDSPTATTAWSWLGRALAVQGRVREALAMHDSAAATARRRAPQAPPPTDVSVARAEALLLAGQAAAAEQEVRPALQRQRETLSPRDPAVADAAVLLMRAMLAQAADRSPVAEPRRQEITRLADEALTRYRALPARARQVAEVEQLRLHALR